MNLSPCPLINLTSDDPLGLWRRAWARALPFIDTMIDAQPPDMRAGLEALRTSSRDPFLTIAMNRDADGILQLRYGLDIAGEELAWLMHIDGRCVGLELDGVRVCYRPDPIVDADLVAVLDAVDDRLRDDGGD